MTSHGLSARRGLRELLSLHQSGSRRIRCYGLASTGGGGSSLAALCLAQLSETLPTAARPLIAVVADETQARALRKDLQFFLGVGGATAGSAEAGADPVAGEPVLGLPDFDVSPWADVSPERAAILRRMGALFRLSQGPQFAGQVVVASVRALARRVVPRAAISELVDIIQADEEFERDRLIKLLTRSGYTRAPVCEDPGTFAVRGGVVDVFVPLYRFPVRIEYFSDLVESLRFFDPQTQRTLRKTSEIFLHPVRETILTKGHSVRDRLLEAGDLAVHPSARTRQLLEQIEAGEDFFGVESLVPAFHAHMASIAEYLPAKPTFFLSEPHLLYDALRDTLLEAETAYRRRLAEHRLGFPPSAFYLSVDEFRALVEGDGARAPQRIEAEPLLVVEDAGDVADAGEGEPSAASESAPAGTPVIPISDGTPTVQFEASDHKRLTSDLLRARVEKHEHMLMPLVRALRTNQGEGVRSVLVASTLQGAERLDGLLRGYGLQPTLHRPGVASLVAEQQTGASLHRFDLLEDTEPEKPAKAGKPGDKGAQPGRGRLELRIGPLLRGFDLPLDRVSLYTEAEIFGEKAVRRAARSPKKPSLGDLKNLEVGAFVVHEKHGVGRYKGLTKLPVRTGGVAVDFVHLEYEGGQLYLPVWRLGEVQRYVGAEGMTPRLDRLGGETWLKTRAKVTREVKQLAEELLQIYAQRQALPGHSFSLKPDEETLYAEFEATFPFEETPDQARAIEDVLGDMEAGRPMDRLVCGDVGYGKTEVAMRAAVKAVLGRKQVAVLAPTTVLVEQHAASFEARMKDLPVIIASLSRFRSKGEQTKVISAVAEGKVDIVIGTHRLLSSDVRFKDLGLVIVDEEQRFGVAHKERLKKLRTQLDTLTLTATPIPRTLHMAMSGLREISIISTAPADRLAIRTIVARDNDDLIRDGIKKELARGGQVFFVHNRVETIGKWARRLHELLPEVRILVGHGQMTPEELEKVMLDFVEGRADVLLATTIIESGLDIPRANTMFVDRADTFGLSQLYQLRGRIGRSTQRAFCYLLVPPMESMTSEAKQRLAVLQRFSELGAGFQIASHDLEIRGAGDLLGTKQSGTIAAVGFELYTRMLEEAVAELRGEPITPQLDPDLTTDLPGFIPEEYLPDTGQRLDFYRRLSVAADEEEIGQVLGELQDRYGTPPDEAQILSGIMVIKAFARRLAASAVELTETRLALALRDETPLRPEHVMKLVTQPRSPWKVTPDQRLVRVWQGDKERADRLGLAKAILADLLTKASATPGAK